MKKFRTLSLILVLVMGLAVMYSNSDGSIDLDANYDGWYLAADEEGVGYKVSHLLYDGSLTSLPVNGYNDSNIEVAGYIYENDTLAFSTTGIYPDWENGSLALNLTLQYNGGEVGVLRSNVTYEAPSTSEPNMFPLDGPPAMLWPILPSGGLNYWNSLISEFEVHNYIVTSDENYFVVGYTNATYSATTTFEKATGLMYNYSYVGVTSDDQGNAVPFEMELTKYFTLSPSNSASFEFFANNPTMAYEVTHAKANGSDGFDFGGINPSENGEGALSGSGYMYQGDFVTVDFSEIRDGFEEGFGYEFDFNDQDTGAFLKLNVSIDLPTSVPQDHDMFLYPMFPLVDDHLIDGYLKMSDIADGLYDWSITSTEFEISYASDETQMSARWSKDTGILNSFFMNDTQDNQTIGFELIAGANLDDFGLGYGVSAGDSLILNAQKVNIDGSNQVTLEEGTGYIGEGDNVTFTVVSASFTNGPELVVDISGPNGNEAGVNFEQPYPGVLEGNNGPPLFSPFYIIGNAEFYSWLDTMYSYGGAVFDASGSTMDISWTGSVEYGSFDLDISIDKSTGSLISYSVNFASTNEAMEPSFSLIFNAVTVDDTPTTTPPTTTGGDTPGADGLGLPINPVAIYTGLFVMTYAIRRKRKSY